MKLKKIIAGVSAAALAASMSCAFSASAITLDATSIDFEDGDCSFVYMNVDDASADPSVLTVEDYDGSKQLKVDVTKASNAPKVWFDLDKIMPREKSVTIKQIDFDLTIVPKNAEDQVGWAGGAVGAAGGFDLKASGKGQANPGWSQETWEMTDENAYTPGAAAKTHITRKFLLPTQMYSAKGTNPFFGLMRWAAETEYVMYFDNITFSDGKNTITVGLPAAEETTAAPEETTAAPAEETTAAPAEETTAAPAETTAEVITEAPAAETTAAPAETTAAPAETTAAPVETTAAPATEAAPAATTTVPATGNTTAAAIVAVMAVAGAAAVITKKRG